MFKNSGVTNVSGLLAALMLILVAAWSCSSSKEPSRVLVFSKTEGFRHSSIEAGQTALRQMGEEHGFVVDTTEDASFFNEENLKQYNAVIFLNTTGDVLNFEQQNSFERFIQAGGGYVGIHAATDTEYDWPWYGKLAGAYFESHPNDPNVKKGTFIVVDKDHSATDFLPEKWERSDEFYNFKNISPDIQTLVTIDEGSYTGGTNGDFHPMSWYQEYDGGRAFYTSMGHTEESFSEPLVLQHIYEGLKYVLGGDNPQALDYEKVRTPKMPEENRFTKVILEEKLDEPMELVALHDGRVIFIERKGAVKLYSPTSNKTKTIARIPVSTKYKDKEGNVKEAEDGLLGIAQDPGFEKNGWLYLFYSADTEEGKNVLARYEMSGDSLLLDSQIIMLEVPVQREQCCHTGGSMTFDSAGNLYLSTGDNTNPHGSNGFSPTDERQGRSAWDAQKSSANTNDLRGKILRIHPEEDGSYTIPEGNLFAKGQDKTRPEIYTMGHRNPFRISVDPKTGYVYWGDVGPDAKDASEDRGPEGFDEIGQARKAGNFGWPHFIADNKAYNRYDFAAGKSMEKFEVAKPVNTSPNNTGLNELPPAQPAFIWYPYAESEEFPLVGTGGRTSMAGPVYYQDQFENAERAFPEYYDGKLLVYEWMRGWIMAVTMDEAGDFVSMEPFMPSYKYSNPMDIEFGPEGDLYMIEYGTGWFQGNDDARLVRVEYNGGNRKPVVVVATDKKAGALPLTASLSSEGTFDYDNDKLQYEWTVIAKEGDGAAQSFDEPNPTITLSKAGIYEATLTVSDGEGGETSQTLEIFAGNEPPELSFTITEGNKTFFFPGETINYDVKVMDREDGSIDDGGIVPEEVAVTIDYLAEGFDQVEIAMGHRSADASAIFAKGQQLIENSDCKACHSVDKKSIGPSYSEVAQRYLEDEEAEGTLAKKIIAGGSGVWGEVAMSAHPQLSESDAREMVKYILSLSAEKATGNSLPIKGAYTTTVPEDDKGVGTYMLRAAYKDKGANGVPGLSSEQSFLLRNSRVPANTADVLEGVEKFSIPDGPKVVIVSGSDAHIGFKEIDLTGITKLTGIVSAPKEYINSAGGVIEVRLDNPEGTVIGRSKQIAPTETPAMSTPPQQVEIEITRTSGFHDLYFVFVNEEGPENQNLFILVDILFHGGDAGTSGAVGK